MAGAGGHLLPQLLRFLGVDVGRQYPVGVTGCGNTTFGAIYAVVADLIRNGSQIKPGRTIPGVDRVEPIGTPGDDEAREHVLARLGPTGAQQVRIPAEQLPGASPMR